MTERNHRRRITRRHEVTKNVEEYQHLLVYFVSSCLRVETDRGANWGLSDFVTTSRKNCKSSYAALGYAPVTAPVANALTLDANFARSRKTTLIRRISDLGLVSEMSQSPMSSDNRERIANSPVAIAPFPTLRKRAIAFFPRMDGWPSGLRHRS